MIRELELEIDKSVAHTLFCLITSCFYFYNGHTSGCEFVCQDLCTSMALSSYNYNKLKTWKLVLCWLISVVLKSISLRI